MDQAVRGSSGDRYNYKIYLDRDIDMKGIKGCEQTEQVGPAQIDN